MILAGPVLRRIACDSSLCHHLHGDGGEPVGVGRRHRTIPGWLRRSLYARDPGCQFPGCPNRLWTDAHHIIHWADGGRTDLDNLIRLCRGHHRHLHDTGIAISMAITDRTWAFTTTDHTPVTAVTALPQPAKPYQSGSACSPGKATPPDSTPSSTPSSTPPPSTPRPPTTPPTTFPRKRLRFLGQAPAPTVHSTLSPPKDPPLIESEPTVQHARRRPRRSDQPGGVRTGAVVLGIVAYTARRPMDSAMTAPLAAPTAWSPRTAQEVIGGDGLSE